MGFHFNAVYLLQNPHIWHHIACPWGRGMGCLLCFETLIHFLLLLLQCHMQYHDKLDSIITALDCISFEQSWHHHAMLLYSHDFDDMKYINLTMMLCHRLYYKSKINSCLEFPLYILHELCQHHYCHSLNKHPTVWGDICLQLSHEASSLLPGGPTNGDWWLSGPTKYYYMESILGLCHQSR